MDQAILIKFHHLKRAEYAYLQDLSEIEFVDISKIDEVIGKITRDRLDLARSIFKRVQTEKNTDDVSLRNPITLPTLESYISLGEVEDYIREAFVREFGDEMIKRVRAGKYPDEIGVRVIVAQKDLPITPELTESPEKDRR